MTTNKDIADLLPDANALRDVADTRRAQAMREAAAQAVDELDHRRTPVATPRPRVRTEPVSPPAAPRHVAGRLPRKVYALAAFTLLMPFATVALVELRDELRASSAILQRTAFAAPALPSGASVAPAVASVVPAVASAAPALSVAEAPRPEGSAPTPLPHASRSGIPLAERNPPHPASAARVVPAPPSPPPSAPAPPNSIASAPPAPPASPSPPVLPAPSAPAPARSTDWVPGRATFVRPSGKGSVP